ncbi:amidase [Piscinibacter koreensis]|uniref:Amidase n=1 Tax=Piscinibacter koreensis TaxID=2742824 RepID=A0A7Y6TV19_9BURK|nr:amidase family protein [Schlegelella koreensis]NUZ04563.1 amidase [Schlegelella koreensis]
MHLSHLVPAAPAPRLARFTVSVIAVAVLAACGGGGSDDDDRVTLKPNRAPFPLVEATIESFHTAMQSGDVSCRDIVQGYLDRIAAYDNEPSAAFPNSPALRSVITTSPTALAQADAMDAEFFGKGRMVGPMHCVPVLAKDNYDTADMKTTGGSLALANNQPPDDAYTIRRLREAGAIIIGKANMDEFAFGFTGSSALGGKTRNAYIAVNSAGGSSSGTGTAIAANLAMVGLGTDTGGSIRVPAAVEGLYGLRPSLRLVSQDGILPLAHGQDTGGPLCRAVRDCALTMDALVGFDPSPFSGQRIAKAWDSPLVPSAAAYATMVSLPTTYTASLRTDGLVGARIGVVRSMFPNRTTANAAFLDALNGALDQMRAAGAIVEDTDIANRATVLTSYASLSTYQFRDDLTAYLTSWSSAVDNHLRSTEAVGDALATLEPTRVANFRTYITAGTNKESNPTYQNNLTPRDEYVIPRVTAALNNVDFATGATRGAAYDVLVYPVLQGFNSLSVNSGSNNRLSPFTGFPAMAIPVGFIKATATSPSVEPVGLEMIAREFSEPTLFRLAAGWERTTMPRVTSPLAPELARPAAPAASASR